MDRASVRMVVGLFKSPKMCIVRAMDPTLLMALDIQAPPTRPQIAEERPWRSAEADAMKRFVDKTLVSYQAQVDLWSDGLRQHRSRANEIPLHPLLEGDYITLDTLIFDLESAAERKATNLARSIKRAHKDIKAAFASNPSLGAVLRDAEKRLHDIEERVIEDLLEHALFVRAFKAERDPNAKGGVEFSNPADLATFLQRGMG